MTTTTIITGDDLDIIDSIITRCDMRDETIDALRSGAETAVEYRVDGDLHLLYFPAACRGAACTNGNSQWTDCDGLDDLADRYANYEERWSN